MVELLAGRGAVVTGAGDIGRAIVCELVSHGATVIAWDADETLFADGFGLGHEEGSRVKAATVDVTSVQSVKRRQLKRSKNSGGSTYWLIALQSLGRWRRFRKSAKINGAEC